jgi:hypothetical protein
LPGRRWWAARCHVRKAPRSLTWVRLSPRDGDGGWGRWAAVADAYMAAVVGDDECEETVVEARDHGRWPGRSDHHATWEIFLGRPPFAPFARALTRFAADLAAPPNFPSDAAMSPAVARAATSPCTLMLISCLASATP